MAPRPNDPFRWTVLAVLLGLTLPALVQRGMFMDGMLYLTVAHNLAHGFGTFWEPRFSQEGFAGLTTFHEHPPLAFGMESLWYRVFGDGFWVEGLYSLSMAFATAALLMVLWRALWGPADPLRRLAWLPVLLWIIVPQVHWCVQNNMQENTMAVFTVAAVLAAVRSARGTLGPWSGPLLVGLLTFLASMVKGLPGLFPLGAPLLYALFADRDRMMRGFRGSVVATATLVGLYGLLWTWPDARHSLLTYAEGRLLHRIDMDPTVDVRWRILPQFVAAMLGPLAIMLLARWTARRLHGPSPTPATANGLALLAIGLSGVLPLMLTMVQKSFYMVAALPLVSMGLACLAAPAVLHLTDGLGERGRRIVLRAGQVALAGVLIASVFLFGRPSRDADMVHDVDRLGAALPAHALVSVESSVLQEWNLQCYLMRGYFISLTSSPGREWTLTRTEDAPPAGYSKVDLDTRAYALWRRDGASGPAQ